MAIELEEKLIALKVVFIYLGKITHFLFSIIYLVLYAKIWKPLIADIPRTWVEQKITAEQSFVGPRWLCPFRWI